MSLFLQRSINISLLTERTTTWQAKRKLFGAPKCDISFIAKRQCRPVRPQVSLIIFFHGLTAVAIQCRAFGAPAGHFLFTRNPRESSIYLSDCSTILNFGRRWGACRFLGLLPHHGQCSNGRSSAPH